MWGTGLCTQFVLHSLSAIGLCWLHPAEGLLHMRLSHIHGMALGVAVFSAPGLLLGLSLSLLAWQFGACLSFVLLDGQFAHYRCPQHVAMRWGPAQCDVVRLFGRSSVVTLDVMELCHHACFFS